MGWLIFGLFLLILLGILGFLNAGRKRKKALKSNRPLDEKVLDACKNNSNYVGNFVVQETEIGDIDWLELTNGAPALSDFTFVVKWRSYGTKCDYKIVATSSEEHGGVVKTSEKYSLSLT